MNYASNKCVKMIQQPCPLLDLLVKEKTGNQDAVKNCWVCADRSAAKMIQNITNQLTGSNNEIWISLPKFGIHIAITIDIDCHLKIE